MNLQTFLREARPNTRTHQYLRENPHRYVDANTPHGESVQASAVWLAIDELVRSGSEFLARATMEYFYGEEAGDHFVAFLVHYEQDMVNDIHEKVTDDISYDRWAAEDYLPEDDSDEDDR